MPTFLAMVIIFASALVQGALSFGFSLIALPLLGMIMPYKTIVPVLTILSCVLNIIILVRLKRIPRLKQIALILGLSLAFTPLGVYLLKWLDDDIMKKAVGAMIIVIALLMRFHKKPLNVNMRFQTILAGILSGILNGSVSLSGPPIVILLSLNATDKQTFRSTLTTMFLMLNVVTIYLYYRNGLFQSIDPSAVVYFIPLVIFGSLVGIFLGNYLNEAHFKRYVLNLLIFMGLINFI